MERYIVINFSNGYAGCREEKCIIFPEGITDDEINMYCSESLNEYADSYGWCCRGEGEDDYEEYLENCTFNWIEIKSEDIDVYKWNRY
jgi:hypothetical protein